MLLLQRSMTKSEMYQLVCEYIIAIGIEGSPSSHVWLMVDPSMSDVYKHNRLVAFLEESEVLTNVGHFLQLTNKGLRMYNEIRTVLLAAKAG